MYVFLHPEFVRVLCNALRYLHKCKFNIRKIIFYAKHGKEKAFFHGARIFEFFVRSVKDDLHVARRKRPRNCIRVRGLDKSVSSTGVRTFFFYIRRNVLCVSA